MSSSEPFKEIPLCPICKKGALQISSDIISCPTCGATMERRMLKNGEYRVDVISSPDKKYRRRFGTYAQWNRLASASQTPVVRSEHNSEILATNDPDPQLQKKTQFMMVGAIFLVIGIILAVTMPMALIGLLFGVMMTFIGIGTILYSMMSVNRVSSQSPPIARQTQNNTPPITAEQKSPESSASIRCPMCHLDMYLIVNECPRCNYKLK